MLTEPDVTLTDYGLALECAALASLLYRVGTRRPGLRCWFAVFFGSIGVAALAGGTVHGFFLDAGTVGQAILWPTSLLAVGFAALAAWSIGARMLFSPGVARGLSMAAAAEFAGYCAVVLVVARTFVVAVVNYVPAATFLFIAFAVVYARERAGALLAAVAGLGLSFAAAGVQQGRLALHPVYFNHNALYHLIQAVALLLIFRGARWLLEAGAPAQVAGGFGTGGGKPGLAKRNPWR